MSTSQNHQKKINIKFGDAKILNFCIKTQLKPLKLYFLFIIQVDNEQIRNNIIFRYDSKQTTNRN